MRYSMRVIASLLLTTTFLSVGVTGSFAAPSNTPPLSVTDDTFVHKLNSAATNDGVNLTVKMGPPGTPPNGVARAAFLRFEYDPSFVWTAAALELVVSDNNRGNSSTSGYGTTFKSFNVKVLGARDANWAESSLTYDGAVATSQDWKMNDVSPFVLPNATDLGNVSVPANTTGTTCTNTTSCPTLGQTFSISTVALASFLNNDPDGVVTLILMRTDTAIDPNLSFASSENTSYSGPKLVVPGQNFSYTVSYDINGGSGTVPSQGSFTPGTAYTVASASGVTPPAGKNFAGWNTKPDGSGTAYAVGSQYTSTESATLYAQYSTNPVVTFDSNDGRDGKSYQSVPNGVQTQLAANGFTRAGYTFTGWNTRQDGGAGGTGFVDAGNITTSANVTLYAQWAANSNAVTYDSRGGSAVSAGSFVTGGSLTLPSAPSRAGYSFAGWFRAASGGTALTSPYSPPDTSDLTLYAQWAALPAQVVTWNPSSTTFLTSDSPTTPSALATTSGDGAITYSVTDAGTTGCTVNQISGVLRFNGVGTCAVRASAGSTNNYLESHSDVVFEIGSTSPAMSLNLELEPGDAVASGVVEYGASGLKANTPWSLIVRSTPQTLASGVYNSSVLAGEIQLPANLEPGWHSITLAGTSPTGSALSHAVWFQVDSSGALIQTSQSQPATEEASNSKALARTGINQVGIGLAVSLALLAGGLLVRKRRASAVV